MLRPIPELTHVFGNASTATIPVVAAVAGRTISIHKLILTASAATNVAVQDSSGAALSQVLPLSGAKGLVLDTNDNGDPYLTTAAGLGVQLAQSGTANVGFDVWTLLSAAPVNVPVFPSGPPGGGGGGSTFVPSSYALSPSRAGLGSTVVTTDHAGQTRVISNVGAVT